MTTSVLSCIQPTSEIHIGNYFGAIQNWVELQDQYECVFGVVDLHAMTVPFAPSQLRENTANMVVSLLACGIDPARSLLFVQSLVPEHTELAWILGCVCSYGELSRMTQFKDKREIVESVSGDALVSAGLFTYPILMAADILIYRPKYVPVGRDQVQHLELARDIARRFNERFGVAYFPEPQPLLTEAPKIMSLADPTKKMSKSLGPKHYIGLFDDLATVESKVKAAVTDTGPSSGEMSPGVANLFTILKASDRAVEVELRREHETGTLKYRDLKMAVVKAISVLTARIRETRDKILSDQSEPIETARESSRLARQRAATTLRDVRSITGLPRA